MGIDITFIENYFDEEKVGNILAIIIGTISLSFSLIFLFIIKYSYFKGMAIPLLLIGTIQITVGIVVATRSSEDKIRTQQYILYNHQKIKTEEIPRMEKVMNNFVIYKWIEIILIIFSIILLLVFYKSSQTFWKGLALGLIIQISIVLSLDIIAEKRGEIYNNNLHYMNCR